MYLIYIFNNRLNGGYIKMFIYIILTISFLFYNYIRWYDMI